MGLFDLLDEEEQKFASDKLAVKEELSIPNGPSEVPTVTEATAPESADKSADVPVEYVEGESAEGWIDANGKKPSSEPVVLYDTKTYPIALDRLVWAPYYRYKGSNFFPARLCDNQEIRLESWVKTWPLPEDEVVVEVFCQAQAKYTTRLLIVKGDKVFPYWAYNSQDKESNYEGPLEWNERRFSALLKIISDKYKQSDAKHIRDRIQATAKEFLEKARAYEAQFVDEDEQAAPQAEEEPSPVVAKKKGKRVKKKTDEKQDTLPSTPPQTEKEPKNAPHTPLFQALLLAQKTPAASDLTLSVGDSISYYTGEGEKESKILSFTSNPKMPLELADGGTLRSTDLVKKMGPRSSVENRDNKEASTKYSMLERFTLNRVDKDSVPSSKKKRARVVEEEKVEDRKEKNEEVKEEMKAPVMKTYGSNKKPARSDGKM